MLSLAVDSTSERGLLGVAAHPQFASNSFIYVFYTTRRKRHAQPHQPLHGQRQHGRAAKWCWSDLPPLCRANHNGGAMHFGTDGKLYVARRRQRRRRELTKPESTRSASCCASTTTAAIPSDNPFCTTQSNLACAVWAHGLRNPFTFAVQPGTGRIHINDVGEGTWEEINVVVARRQLRMAGDRRAHQAHRRHLHRCSLTITTQRAAEHGQAASSSGLLIGGAFYPSSGPFPRPLRVATSSPTSRPSSASST